MKFCVVNLGCKVNRVESDEYTISLQSRGWQTATLPDADIVIINTCTVTGEAEKKTRKALRRALRENSSASVLVTGCAAVIDPETYLQMDERVFIEPDKTKVAEAVLKRFIKEGSIFESDTLTGTDDKYALGFPSHDSGVTAKAISPQGLRTGKGFLTRVGIKVQDGCNNACSFCIVHKARGKAWSRDFDSIREEVQAYEAAGVKELVLTGINLGSYQRDGRDIVDLLQSLLEGTKNLRFRLSSIEPRDVDIRLIECIAAAQGRICRHLHLPLQSGSEKVLKEMRRPYTLDYYKNIVDQLYASMPTFSLSTDIIVGFPGETDEDFEETLQMAQYCRFSKIHVFPYSKREGTIAAGRDDQILPGVKQSRVAKLTELSDHLRQCDYISRLGMIEDVLVEAKGKGMTESYHQVFVPLSAKPGELLQIKLTKMSATNNRVE